MMSSKKHKSLTPWSACNMCNAIITQRDSVLHQEKSCPPNPSVWIHPYIWGNDLHSSVQTFQVKDANLQFIARENQNDYILIPLHVLQICQIPIGDPVVVKPLTLDKIVPFIKLAWPLAKRTDFTVMISEEVLELNALSLDSQVIISKLEEEVSLAEVIVLSLESDKSYLDDSSFRLNVEKDFTNKVLCIGNAVLFKWYGKKIIFKVEKILPYENCNKVGEQHFYLTGPNTRFVFAGDSQVKEQKIVKKLGGLDEVIEELKDTISFICGLKHYGSELNMARGILIHGPVGTGKSSLIELIAENFTENVVKIQCTKISSRVAGETEKELSQYFEKAIQLSPAIILIDDLDLLCTKSVSEYEKRIVATLALLMDKLNKNNLPVAVLATTSKIHCINGMLRSSTRFAKEVEIYVSSCSQRFEILNVLLSELDHKLTELQIKDLADSLHGFVGGDLVSLVSKALLKNHKFSQGKEKLSLDDFLWAVTKTKPSAMKEIMVEIPNVKWEDIGGQKDLKLKLKQCIEWPFKYKDSFSRLGITPPKGLLMFGPPGCSKTMIAKAIATESNLNFISVKGPELFNKWVGESERAVRNVFKRARQTAPSIVFFDEIDAIGGERDISSGSNVQDRVLAQLLVELDGVEPLDNVTIIAATNRPDRIDSALLRPGRLDRIIYVPLPDLQTRKEIIVLQLKNSCVSDDIKADDLAEMTDGYSGAEIVAVCREAALKALEDDFDAQKVERRHFITALGIVIPRTPKTLLDIYKKYIQK